MLNAPRPNRYRVSRHRIIIILLSSSILSSRLRVSSVWPLPN